MARPGKPSEPLAGPKFVRYFHPVLTALKELGGSARPAEVRAVIAQRQRVPDAELNETTESGGLRFDNQVAWARFYLAKAGLLDASSRGVWTLTEAGRQMNLAQHQTALDLFKRVHAQFSDEEGEPQPGSADAESALKSPPEVPATRNHRHELREILLGLPPSGFERLCQLLLRESGFQDVVVTGRSGDGGIDGHGILQLNALVSFRAMFQCKRYAGAVSPSHLRDFRGAMMGRADKGIFLTTGSFSAEARREAIRDGAPPLELVDGEKLADMMEELKLGLRPVTAYQVDVQFFEQFRV